MVRNWANFEKNIRLLGQPLLKQLDLYPDAVLVAGCQRSGTTAVTRLIREAGNMESFQFTPDDELDAALILSGHQSFKTTERTCFQTTYLNDSYAEYFEHSNYRLVWILRRPDAVACSMLYNWKRQSLNRLFNTCGSTQLNDKEMRRYRLFGTIGFSRLHKICLSYNSKAFQIQKIATKIPKDRLIILDYDDLVLNPKSRLKSLFSFLELPYNSKFDSALHKKSIRNSQKLRVRDHRKVEQLCQSTYEHTLKLAATHNTAFETNHQEHIDLKL